MEGGVYASIQKASPYPAACTPLFSNAKKEKVVRMQKGSSLRRLDSQPVLSYQKGIRFRALVVVCPGVVSLKFAMKSVRVPMRPTLRLDPFLTRCFGCCGSWSGCSRSVARVCQSLVGVAPTLQVFYPQWACGFAIPPVQDWE